MAIRNYLECENGIEKSDPRITVWHHQACRVMTTGDPEGPIFLFTQIMECEGWIEKSEMRVTVWHHEACRVITNGDPKGQIFLSHPHTKNGFFPFPPSNFAAEL